MASSPASLPLERQLRAASAEYSADNICCAPLRRDADGIAKVPIDDRYPRFRPAENADRDWQSAEGLGIVLGKASGNLAVVDVDDAGLSDYLLRHLRGRADAPLMTITARQRLHIYVLEPIASLPVDLEVRYSGRRCLVQLLATSCICAAPPTPGYRWNDEDAQPIFGLVAEVWKSLAQDFNLPYQEARKRSFLRRERSRGPTTAQLREGLR